MPFVFQGEDDNETATKLKKDEKLFKTPYTIGVVNFIMYAYHAASKGHPGTDVFNGGHVRVQDNCLFYNKCRAMILMTADRNKRFGLDDPVPGGSRLYSQSHPTTNEPFEITLPEGWGCILVGTWQDGQTHHSWFQMEATSVCRSVGSMAKHTAVDFAKYKATGLQQGPCGMSKFSDKSPLIVDLTNDTECAQLLVS